MSKRELRALVGAEDPASPAPEPEAEEEAPIFRFSHTLALIASYWGPDFVWVIVLYCGYKLRKLLEKMPLLALVTICMVIVSSFLATQ